MCVEKELFYFQAQTNAKGIVYYSRTCKKCSRDKLNENQKKWRSENKEHIQEYNNANKEAIYGHHLKFREANREELRQVNKEYYADNKEEIKERQKDKKPVWDRNYYEKNKKKVQKIQSRRVKERYNSEPDFRIRKTVSKAISRHLKLNGSSKNGNSCLNFLPYTMQKLKMHLESQFRDWMTWDNYGVYNRKTWNDTDASTWTWQIDHIIPHSDFEYKIMDDDNFKMAWDLEKFTTIKF